MGQIQQKISPNYDERGGVPVDILVLHYTGMKTGAQALERLVDPTAKVSAHYFVEEDGSVFQLVEEDKCAWHAGVSSWAGDRNINARSIGIELVNPGHEWGYTDFPEAQMTALLHLAQGIVARHSIPKGRILGHSDVAPARKTDPGEKFNWRYLASKGLGLWVEADTLTVSQITPLRLGARQNEIALWREKLGRFGYEASCDTQGLDYFDEALVLATEAFQRHFMPHHLGRQVDGTAFAVLDALIAEL